MIDKGDITMFCKHCGEELYEEQTICIKCGNSVLSEEQYNGKYNKNKKGLTEKNKLFVIILCALFGCIGAHNFYMGETKKGIIKIIFFFIGISSILSIIDLIKIISDKYSCNA